MTEHWAGIDGEMTGGKMPGPGEKPACQSFQLVQIGVALESGDTFFSDIGYDKWNEDPKAMEVHKMTADRIRAAPRAEAVDASLLAWLEARGITRAIPIGWSVGTFDMPFVREYLPRSAALISKRSVDLNGVVYTLMQVTGRSYNALKSASKKYAEKALEHRCFQPEPAWHHAGYDAEAALKAWEFFRSLIVAKEIHDFL